MKLAQFRRTLDGSNHTYVTVLDENDARHSVYQDGYTRISQWVEVDFPPRAPEEYVPEQLARLDAAEAELRTKFQERLNQLAEARANIRALTVQP